MVLDSEIDANAISKLLLASTYSEKYSGLVDDGEDENGLPRKITDKVMRNLYQMEKDVKSLNLSSCDAITDLGFVPLGKYWPNLESICLGGCKNITVVGLRSLALNCRKIRRISFVDYEIDDAGLRIIAASLVDLETIDLTGCLKVTDRGLSEIAHCCTKLKTMKLGGCYKLGESGIWAFREVGSCCTNLEEIDLSDVTYLSDKGLLLVAKRCLLLKKIHISRCPYVSSRAITKVFKYASKLIDFAASESCNALSYDELTTMIEASADRLERLDLSYCGSIQVKEVELICRCRKLVDLKFSECNIDDKSIQFIAKNLHDLTGLEIFNCKFISDEVIHLLRPKENGTGISYLGLTGCSGVRKETLLDEASKFNFSNLIINENCMVFHPRENEIELRKEAQISYERRVASTNIQRVVRGGLVRCGIIRRKRQERAVSIGIPKLQGLIRGKKQRTLTMKLRRDRIEHRAVSKIENAFHSFVFSRIYHKEVKAQKAKRRKTKAASILQGHYRRHTLRISMHQKALEHAREVLRQRKEDEMKQKAALTIQCFVRAKLSQMKLLRLRKDYADERALFDRRCSATHTIQCAIRGTFSRSKLSQLRRKMHEIELRSRSAETIQCFWRVTKSKRDLEQLRYFKQIEVHTKTAMRIQSLWRGKVGRDKFQVLFSVYELKKREQFSALQIQSAYRGMLGRRCAERIILIAAQEQKRKDASVVVQKYYRGFIGRENAYVRMKLRSIDSKAHGIQLELQVKALAIEKTEKEVEECQCLMKEKRTFINLQKRELRDVSKSKKRFVDTTVVNGVNQRVEASIVVSTLKKNIEEGEKTLLRLDVTGRDLRERLRGYRVEKKRIHDNLLDITSRAEVKIRYDRRERLRAQLDSV